MGLLEMAKAAGRKRVARKSKGKEVKKSKDDLFLEAQRSKARHYAKMLNLADSLKLGRVKNSFEAKRIKEAMEKRSAKVIAKEDFGPIEIRQLASGIKEVHLPAGISGKAYNNDYRDYLMK